MGTLTVTASTFSGNSATLSGGVIFTSGALFSASILADSPSGGNCGGTINSEGSNLSDDDSCGFGVDEQGEANLAALADNGGPTQTMLPQAPSDALDAANCLDSSAVDQRGAPRPADDCDIGAVEVEADVAVQLIAYVNLSGVIDEGASAQLLAIAYGPNNANLIYGFDCDDSASFDTPGDSTGTSSTGICAFDDNGEFVVSVRVCDSDDAFNCDVASPPLTIFVNNLPPVIDSITTNAAAPQGQPVTVTVNASDLGINDTLMYSFDCDDDGVFEVGPQAGNQAQCLLNPAAATSTINVLVEDGDGGSDSDSVVVGQVVTLCGNFYIGALSAPTAGGACPTGTVALTVPAVNPVTLCINPYRGALTWSPGGSCGPNTWTHIVPGSGPLSYCRHLWTGRLSYSPTGQCGVYETAGIIPG